MLDLLRMPPARIVLGGVEVTHVGTPIIGVTAGPGLTGMPEPSLVLLFAKRNNKDNRDLCTCSVACQSFEKLVTTNSAFPGQGQTLSHFRGQSIRLLHSDKLLELYIVPFFFSHLHWHEDF
jgi:hypothetical protein